MSSENKNWLSYWAIKSSPLSLFDRAMSNVQWFLQTEEWKNFQQWRSRLQKDFSEHLSDHAIQLVYNKKTWKLLYSQGHDDSVEKDFLNTLSFYVKKLLDLGIDVSMLTTAEQTKYMLTLESFIKTEETHTNNQALIAQVLDNAPPPLQSHSCDKKIHKLLSDRTVTKPVKDNIVRFLSWLKSTDQSIEAEDILQEVLIKAVEKSSSFIGDKVGFIKWFQKMAKNHCIDFTRNINRAKRRVHLKWTQWKSDSWLNRVEEMLTDQQYWEIPVDNQWLQVLYHAILALTEKQKKVILLRYFQGKSFKEIAAELNIPTNTALWAARYAKKNLSKNPQIKQYFLWDDDVLLTEQKNNEYVQHVNLCKWDIDRALHYINNFDDLYLTTFYSRLNHITHSEKHLLKQLFHDFFVYWQKFIDNVWLKNIQEFNEHCHYVEFLAKSDDTTQLYTVFLDTLRVSYRLELVKEMQQYFTIQQMYSVLFPLQKNTTQKSDGN